MFNLLKTHNEIAKLCLLKRTSNYHTKFPMLPLGLGFEQNEIGGNPASGH